ncbi:TPA: molybdopterin-guanine dinucleotide biosynthesis protein B [Candidatus Bathyarchaeota archaeon]|nr:molybdopterin-guanine dinucleotide biosynthesis protein B [Candidatus Bathyarchaeota archaeon]
MGAPRVVAVVGFKAAGKTRVVEALVAELTRRGHRVGTLKHTAEDMPLDKEGTDTYRHAEAGAVSSAILSDNRTAIFLRRAMNLQRAADALGEVDFIVLEGFKTIDVAPRIIVPRGAEEVSKLRIGVEIASVDVDGKVPEAGDLPVVPVGDPGGLADIVEARAYPLLAGLNCKACGFKTCGEMGVAILAGETEAAKCVKYGGKVVLRVDGSVVALNKFTGSALANVILGFLKTLKGSESPHRVELEFEVRGDA